MEPKNDINNHPEERSELLDSISKAPVYQVPEGYFEHLPEALTAAVTGAGELPSWLEGPLSPQAKVPPGYFDNFPQKMLEAARRSEAPKGKLVPLVRSFRYAAAAAIVVFMFLGLWKFQQAYNTAVPLYASFEKIPDDELVEYVDLQPVAGNGDLAYTNSGGITFSEEDIMAMLEDYSSQELEEFLRVEAPVTL